MNSSNRPALAGIDIIAVMLIWCVATAAQIATRHEFLGTWQFPDPDDALRLVQVRDWLAGQSWFDVTQYRISPPDGVPMHWSRLVDVPIGIAIKLLMVIFSQERAEALAIIAIPVVMHLTFLFGIFMLTLNVTWQRQTAVLACLLSSLAVGIAGQFRPMRIDHHGLQITLTIAAAAMLFKPQGGARTSAIAGLLMAIAVVVSIESLPMALAMAGLLAFRYLASKAQGAEMAGFLLGLTTGCLSLLILTSRLNWATELACDSMSAAYVFPLLALTCGAVLTSLTCSEAGGGARFTALAVTAAVAALVGVVIAPDCLHGPFSGLVPLLREFWYANVKEGLPLWQQSLPNILISLLGSGIGLAASFIARSSSVARSRDAWTGLIVLQIAALLVAVMVNRAMAVSHALAIPANAWLLLNVFSWSMRQSAIPLRLAFATLSLLLIPQISMLLALAAIGKLKEPAAKAALSPPECLAPATITALNAAPPALIFAPLDMGPAILVSTRDSVVATGHHRNQRGMHAVIAGFTATPAVAEPLIRGTGSKFVAYCNAIAETTIYAHYFPHSLAAELSSGEVPAWLTLVQSDQSGFRLYKIADPKADANGT